MENFQVPHFKHPITKKKHLQNWEWFEIDDSQMVNSTFDDYILLKREIKETPIIGYVAKLFGARIAKKEAPLDNRT